MKGSITPEAVVVVGMIVLILMWTMKTAIGLYQETAETALLEWLNIEDAAEWFRYIRFAEQRMR